MSNEILKKVLENTEKIIKNTEKVEEKNNKLQAQIDSTSDIEDVRKEQLRQAQKNFKKIGCNIKDDLFDKFEELAQKLGYSNTSAFCRSYLLLLLENEQFQKTFIEFSVLLNDSNSNA